MIGDDLAEGSSAERVRAPAGRSPGASAGKARKRPSARGHPRAGDLALPALLLLSQWLPGRTAQIRKQKEAAVVLADGPSPERRRLLAMRAAFSLPYGHLLRYTEDPIGDAEGGRYDALVAAAFEDAGLRSN